MGLQPLHATSSLLEPATDTEYRPFDYLVDATSADPSAPPVRDATWRTLAEYGEPDDLVEVAWEAARVGHIDLVRRALDRATAQDNHLAAEAVAQCLGEAGHEYEAADRLELIIAAATGSLTPLDLLRIGTLRAWYLGATVADRGDAEQAAQVSHDLVSRQRRTAGREVSAHVDGPTHLGPAARGVRPRAPCPRRRYAGRRPC